MERQKPSVAQRILSLHPVLATVVNVQTYPPNRVPAPYKESTCLQNMKITFSKNADLHSNLIFNYEVEPNEENRTVQRQIGLIFIPTHASKIFLVMHKTIKAWESFYCILGC